MRFLTALALALLVVVPTTRAQAPVGDWGGALEIPGAPEPLRFVLHVTMTGDSLGSTLDLAQQGAFGYPATTTTYRNDSLIVTFAEVSARLSVAVAPDSLRGTFSQGGTLPVVLGPAAPLVRSQTPVGPFPYATEEVTVDAAPGVVLAGTFVRPAGAGPFPAVLLLTGSGAQDRDEALAGHRPFAVLADHLARNGIASLRLDDRGEGASTGDYATATLDDMMTDARAALAALRARPGVARAGVVGLLAPRVGADFVVMLAAPAVPGADLYTLQMERVAAVSGVDSTAAVAFSAAVRATLQPLLDAPTAPDSVLQAPMEAALNRGLAPIPTAARSRLGLAGGGYARARRAMVEAMLTPELRGFFLSDPAPDLAALSVPALALYGGLDVQVPADQNAGPMRAALAGRPGSGTVVLDGKNHLFQTATTGGPTEYGQIDETMSPEALDAVTAWILRTAGR